MKFDKSFTRRDFNDLKRAVDGQDIWAHIAFNECAMSDGDSRTPLLSFSEWVNAGKPCRPARA